MITFLLIILLIISIGINVAAYIIIQKLLGKVRIYEQWIFDFKGDVKDTLELMQSIDRQGTFATSVNDKGTFESDDQVGQIFKELLGIVEDLNSRSI